MVGRLKPGKTPPSWSGESPYPLGNFFKPPDQTNILLLLTFQNQPHFQVVPLSFNTSTQTLRGQRSSWFEMLALGMVKGPANVRLVSASSRAQQANLQATSATTAGAARGPPPPPHSSLSSLSATAATTPIPATSTVAAAATASSAATSASPTAPSSSSAPSPSAGTAAAVQVAAVLQGKNTTLNDIASLIDRRAIAIMFEGDIPYFVVVDLPTNRLVLGGDGIPDTIPAFLGQSNGIGLDQVLMHDDLGQVRARLNATKDSLLVPLLEQVQALLGGTSLLVALEE